MKKTIIMGLFLAIFNQVQAKDYICYYLIHVQISHTLEEHNRQVNMRNNQSLVTGLEANNQSEVNTFKKTYKTIKNRLNTLGLLFDGINIGTIAYPELQSIVNTQSKLVQLVVNQPALAFVVKESEKEFVDNAYLLVNYIAGLVLSYGSINQMNPADRRLLLDHALNEIKNLDATSFNAYWLCQDWLMTQKLKKLAFTNWVNQDRDIIKDIMTNVKNLF